MLMTMAHSINVVMVLPISTTHNNGMSEGATVAIRAQATVEVAEASEATRGITLVAPVAPVALVTGTERSETATLNKWLSDIEWRQWLMLGSRAQASVNKRAKRDNSSV